MTAWLRMMAAVLAIVTIGASNIPNGAEGRRDSFVHDGKQNYPVSLQGIARDWDRDCSRGRARECERLGDAFLEGLGDLVQDLRAAMGYWLLACDAGSGGACVKAANAIEAGTTHYPANPRLAFETVDKGCARGDNGSCAVTALHYYRGEVVSADRARALQYWDNGCAARDEDSCRLKAGALYNSGNSAGEVATAVALYRAGCDRKQGWGCSGYAEALLSGKGVAVDERQAFRMAERGCLEGEGGNTIPACTIHATNLAQSGDREKVDLAGSLLTDACLSGHAPACYQAGLLGYSNPAGNPIAQWEVPVSLRNGCDLGHAASCSSLASIYDEGFGSLNDDGGIRSVALFDKSCQLGDELGCQMMTRLGDTGRARLARLGPINPADPASVQLAQAVEMIEVAGTAQDALIAAGRLMEEGVGDAEWLVGGWYYYGKPGVLPQNRENGIILIGNAARQRHLEALKWMAMAMWEGDGVPEDRRVATIYMAHAAAQGDEMAIAIYRSMLAQPERDRRAREAEESRRLAEERRNDFWYNFSLAAASWSSAASSSSSGPSYSSAAADQSWQRHQSSMDSLHWNQRMSYLTGGTTACNTSNPYC